MSPPNFHRLAFRIGSLEADANGRARPLTLLEYLNEAASQHAEMLGFSIAQLMKRQMTWLLSRYHIRIERLPRTGETIDVLTWPSARSGLRALRDFEIRDEKKEILLSACSLWLLVSLESRRPLRLDGLLTLPPLYDRRALVSDFPTLPEVSRSDIELTFRVRFADIDINRHVNHTVYVGWALETMPEEMIFNAFPREIEAVFLAETFWGQEVACQTQRLDQPTVFSHRLLDSSRTRELARLRTEWTMPSGNKP